MSRRSLLVVASSVPGPLHLPLCKLVAALASSIALTSVVGVGAALVPTLTHAQSIASTSKAATPHGKLRAKAAVKPVAGNASTTTAHVAPSSMNALALANVDSTCNTSVINACQIIAPKPSPVAHEQQGSAVTAISYNFNDTRTFTAVSGSTGWGAVQFETFAGDGGSADSDDHPGGGGGVGASVTATIGSGITAQGVNAGGILRFTSLGGDGGGGQGHTGPTDSPQHGVSGVGGVGGAITVDLQGSVSSFDANSPGVLINSTGGSSPCGDQGSNGHWGSFANSGGAGGAVSLTVEGSISTQSVGASVVSAGGMGGLGVDDTSSVSAATGRDGGTGGAGSTPA